MAESANQPFLTVYEAANDALRELYIGVTAKDLRQATLDFAAAPPRAIAHWRADPPKALRYLASGLDKAEVRAFVDGYVRQPLLKTWTVIRDD